MGSPSYLRIKLCIDAATVRNQAAAAPAPADAAPVALAAIPRVTPASIEPLSPPVDEHLMRANEAASREMAVDAAHQSDRRAARRRERWPRADRYRRRRCGGRHARAPHARQRPGSPRALLYMRGQNGLAKFREPTDNDRVSREIGVGVPPSARGGRKRR
jgi:hypothetical protein